MRNRYLRDRMIGRNRDMRNPYGSRGGYVSSDRGYDRTYDRNYDRNYDRGYDRGYDMRDDEFDMRHDYKMMDRTYDRGYDRNYDYASMERDYYDELTKWCEKLKNKAKLSMSDNDIINKAKQMGLNFKDYSEKDLITTFYMLQSDFPNLYGNPEGYISMSKEWLEDKDAELMGNEKLTAYYYTIIKGE